MCEIGAIIRKDELYARGWIRLFEHESSRTALEEMLRYLMGVTKLYRSHMDRCQECAEDYDRHLMGKKAEAA